MAEYVVEFGKDGSRVEPDGRLDAAAFHRNHQAIWAVLQPFLAGKSGDVVEAGSGTGQHVVEFARHTPDITWWPSDLNAQHLKSIAAWQAHAGLANVRAPLRIDLSDPAWCAEMQDGSGPSKLLAVFCANVIHIAPWRVAEGLFAGAGRYLHDLLTAQSCRRALPRNRAWNRCGLRLRWYLATYPLRRRVSSARSVG